MILELNGLLYKEASHRWHTGNDERTPDSSRGKEDMPPLSQLKEVEHENPDPFRRKLVSHLQRG
jgi:hypothetical protein